MGRSPQKLHVSGVSKTTLASPCSLGVAWCFPLSLLSLHVQPLSAHYKHSKNSCERSERASCQAPCLGHCAAGRYKDGHEISQVERCGGRSPGEKGSWRSFGARRTECCVRRHSQGRGGTLLPQRPVAAYCAYSKTRCFCVLACYTN